MAAWRVFPTDQARSAMTALLADQHPDDVLPGDPPVTGVAFSPDGKLVAAGAGHGTVRLWDPAIDQAVGVPLPADTGPAGGVNGVAFSPDGKLLATADTDGTVRTWHMSLLADPYTALCVDVGPPTKTIWMQYAAGEPQPSVCGEA